MCLLKLSEFIVSILILCTIRIDTIVAYTQVSISGNNNNNHNNKNDDNNGPKVFKALNMDLIFPKVFNATENSFVLTTPIPIMMKTKMITTTTPLLTDNQLLRTTTIKPTTADTKLFTQNESTNAESTGRAVDYRPYPFQQLITTPNKGRPQTSALIVPSRNRPPTQSSYNTRTYVKSRPISANVYPIYPSGSKLPSRAEIDKLRGKGQAMDRFSPSQAVASALFKSKGGYSYNNPLPEQSQSDSVSAYLPPKDLYSFPPNLNAKYPSPMESDGPSGVNSYLPPASGPISDHDFKGFVGPVNPDYLPDSLKGPPSDDDKKPSDDGPGNDSMTNSDDMMGGADMDSDGDDRGMMMAGGGDEDMKNDDHDHEHEYPTPPADYLDNSPAKGKSPTMDDDPMMDQDHPMDNGHAMDQDETMDHDHHHGHDEILDHPPHGYHDHPRDHGSFSDYFSHGFPELIYDDHPHHHYHHPTEPPPPPTTTQAPEPPPEPRVKKYSYFYIGRKLWYIPLYFTVWFSFYVLWLILKSIARHKVNLPNHYVSKRSIEAIDTMSYKQAKENIDNLTVNVMNKIEQFKEKYL